MKLSEKDVAQKLSSEEKKMQEKKKNNERTNEYVVQESQKDESVPPSPRQQWSIHYIQMSVWWSHKSPHFLNHLHTSTLAQFMCKFSPHFPLR